MDTSLDFKARQNTVRKPGGIRAYFAFGRTLRSDSRFVSTSAFLASEKVQACDEFMTRVVDGPATVASILPRTINPKQTTEAAVHEKQLVNDHYGCGFHRPDAA